MVVVDSTAVVVVVVDSVVGAVVFVVVSTGAAVVVDSVVSVVGKGSVTVEVMVMGASVVGTGFWSITTACLPRALNAVSHVARLYGMFTPFCGSLKK